MLLRYTDADGKQVEVDLGNKPITIGRSQDATIMVPGEKASRIHCAIRFWDGDYVIKDMKSRNGTFVNERRVETAIIRPGDRIRIGSAVIQVDQKSSKGATTILREVGQEMEEGKGYKTILREIVQSAEDTTQGKDA